MARVSCVHPLHTVSLAVPCKQVGSDEPPQAARKITRENFLGIVCDSIISKKSYANEGKTEILTIEFMPLQVLVPGVLLTTEAHETTKLALAARSRPSISSAGLIIVGGVFLHPSLRLGRQPLQL